MSEPFRVRQWAKDRALAGYLYVVASFDFDEPLISGFGETEDAALSMAGKRPPSGSTICRRVAACNELLWRDQAGREVRSEHFRSSIQQGEFKSWQ